MKKGPPTRAEGSVGGVHANQTRHELDNTIQNIIIYSVVFLWNLYAVYGLAFNIRKKSDETSRNSIAINSSNLARVPSTELSPYNRVISKNNVDPDSPKTFYITITIINIIKYNLLII